MPMATKTSPTGMPNRRVAPVNSALAASRMPPVVRRSAVLKGSPEGTDGSLPPYGEKREPSRREDGGERRDDVAGVAPAPQAHRHPALHDGVREAGEHDGGRSHGHRHLGPGQLGHREGDGV